MALLPIELDGLVPPTIYDERRPITRAGAKAFP
jgi:hypothetical protein